MNINNLNSGINYSHIKSKIVFLWKDGALHIFAGNFLTKFIAFFGSMFLSRLLSKNDLGVLSYIENISSYVYIIAGLGLYNGYLRYGILSETIERKYSLFHFITSRSLLIDIVVVIVAILVSQFYNYEGNFATASTLIPVMLLSIPFQDQVNILQMNERVMFNNRGYAYISLLYGGVLIISKIIAAYYGGVKLVVYTFVISNAILAIVLYIQRKNTYFPFSKNRLSEFVANKKEILKYSLQYMVTNGLWSFFMLVDIFLIGFILKKPELVADFKIAYAFPANLTIISVGIGLYVVPRFVKNENDSLWVSREYKKVLSYTTIFMGIISIAICFAAKPLIWLFGPQYYNVIPLMRLLIVGSFIDTSLRYTTANLLAAMGKIKYNMLVSFCGFTVKTIMNIVLLPRLGLYAIAISSIFIQFVMTVVLIYIFKKEFYA